MIISYVYLNFFPSQIWILKCIYFKNLSLSYVFLNKNEIYYVQLVL